MATKKKPIEDLSEVTDAPVEPQDVPDVVETGFDPEAPVAEPVEPDFVVAGDGDSYASLAARLAPEGVRARDFARELLVLNGGAPVRPGMMVKVK